MTTAVPQATALTAPASWRTVDFISDLHLQAAEPATFATWQRYMLTSPADALFILGDLFEVWVGDDALTLGTAHAQGQPSFDDQCADVLRLASERMRIYFMHGNRDFLVGQAAMRRINGTLLADPTTLAFGGQRYVLSHGDALCIDDTGYMQFRQQVRSAAWQQAFLAKPLAERQALGRQLREQSEAKKQSGTTIIDVDAPSARQLLQAAQAQVLIHGHTHQPAQHDLGNGLRRVVLSDWHAALDNRSGAAIGTVHRAEVLRLRLDLQLKACELQRLPLI